MTPRGRIGAAVALLLVVAACARPVPPSGPLPATADANAIETSIFLIGDAGDPARPEPVLQALSREIARDPDKSFVLIMGDNVYEKGIDSLPTPPEAIATRRDQERRLAAQLDVLLTHQVRGIVVPGNHDWAKHAPAGFASIRAQEAFVRQYVDSVDRAARLEGKPGAPTIEFLPAAGCPGPAVEDIGEHLRVLVLDTQWWLHPYDKPSFEACRGASRIELVDSLRVALAGGGGRRTMVVSHHPIETAGEHGGFFGWKSYLFPLTEAARWAWLPLPLIGSMYPLARQHGFTPQDQSSVYYCRLEATLDSAFDARPPLLYAAGHDHNLQVFKGGGVPYSLVSGGGRYGKYTPVTRRANSLLSLSASGFMRLDVMKDDSPPRLSVHVVDGTGRSQEMFAIRLEERAVSRGGPARSCREQPGLSDMMIQVPGREY